MIEQVSFQQHQSMVPTGVEQSMGDIVAGNSAFFLFSPRDINPHYKRPIIYNMNNSLIESISEHIINRPTASHSIQSVLNGTPDIHRAIVPVAQGGFNIATQAYSDHWMFVLITDEGGQEYGGLTNKLMTRTVTIGICAQEPISRSGLVSMTPEQFLNPSCQLVITRRFQMVKVRTEGAYGPQFKIRTVNDDNVVQFDPNLWETKPNDYDKSCFYTMMPAEVQSVSNFDGEGITSLLSHENSLNVKGNTKIASNLESPKQHVKDIITAFETGMMHTNYGSDIGTFGDGLNPFEQPKDTFDSYVRSAFVQHSSLHNTFRGETIQDPTAIYLNIGMVMANFHPKVFPIQTPRHTNAEIIPQNVISINNVFSSLVCAVLPTYLNTVGLSAVSFMYNSAYDTFQVLHIESVINVSQQELHFKWNALITLLKQELFPVLLGNGGPFDMQVMSSVNSTTDVVLNFLDFEAIPIGSIYQENAVLGGIVSPLIGTAEHIKYNSVQLNNLIRNVGEHISPSYR